MEGKEGAVESYLTSPAEVEKIRKDFAGVVRGLSQDGQDFMSEMTSILTESDIYQDFKANPGSLSSFQRELEKLGLSENKISTIFRYFNLEQEQIKK